jgi:hypothetical protein
VRARERWNLSLSLSTLYISPASLRSPRHHPFRHLPFYPCSSAAVFVFFSLWHFIPSLLSHSLYLILIILVWLRPSDRIWKGEVRI